MSSPLFPRRDFIDCSPRTNRIASTMFDLPEPFGPTIAVIGVANSRMVGCANDLKPLSSSRFNNIQDALLRMYVLYHSHPFSPNAFRAALCSASCLDLPSPLPASSSPRKTPMLKCLSWTGPDSLSTLHDGVIERTSCAFS